MHDLTGTTALVTGAARRVGRAIALALGQAGVDVAIHYHRSADAAESLRAELEGLGVQAWTLQADFRQEADLRRLIPDVLAAAGRLDFLVNSAAAYPQDRLEEVEFASLTASLATNAWAPFLLAREFARLAPRGKIVNLIDARIGGHDPGQVSYLLGKKMLADLTGMLAIELAPGFSVNAIAPGLVLPPDDMDQAKIDRLVRLIPLARAGTPDDLVEAVLYLLRAEYLTGQVLYVDGGRHLVGSGPRGRHP